MNSKRNSFVISGPSIHPVVIGSNVSIRNTRKVSPSSSSWSAHSPAHSHAPTMAPPPKRRYCCEKCQYSTDRRDLYSRHENIHRTEKPFKCYICEKQFNRADHVKKHFLRIHKGIAYDVKKTKRIKGRDYDVSEYQSKRASNESNPLLSQMLSVLTKNSATTMTTEWNESANDRKWQPQPEVVQEADEEVFECEYCGCSFVDYSSLHSHRFLLHKYLKSVSQMAFNHQNSYRCVVCNQTKANQRSIMAHMTCHVGMACTGEGGACTGRGSAGGGVTTVVGGVNRRKQLQPKKIIKLDQLWSQTVWGAVGGGLA